VAYRDFRARISLFAGGERILDQHAVVDMQPPSLGRIERAAFCGAASDGATSILLEVRNPPVLDIARGAHL
jgi:hypothetical protein